MKAANWEFRAKIILSVEGNWLLNVCPLRESDSRKREERIKTEYPDVPSVFICEYTGRSSCSRPDMTARCSLQLINLLLTQEVSVRTCDSVCVCVHAFYILILLAQ